MSPTLGLYDSRLSVMVHFSGYHHMVLCHAMLFLNYVCRTLMIDNGMRGDRDRGNPALAY